MPLLRLPITERYKRQSTTISQLHCQHVEKLNWKWHNYLLYPENASLKLCYRKLTYFSDIKFGTAVKFKFAFLFFWFCSLLQSLTMTRDWYPILIAKSWKTESSKMYANPTNIRFWMTPVVHPQWCWCWWWGLTLALPLPVILFCWGWVVSSWQGSGVHIILTCSSVSALHQDSVRSNGELALFPMNNQCAMFAWLTEEHEWGGEFIVSVLLFCLSPTPIIRK